MTYRSSSLPHSGLFIVIVFLIALTGGAAIAVLPAGVSIKILIILFVATLIVLGWGYRSSGVPAVWKLLQYICLCVISLSVLWPRYIFIQKDGLPGINPLTLGCMLLIGLCISQLISSSGAWQRVKEQYDNGGLVSKLVVIWFLWRFFASLFGDYPMVSIFELIREFVYISCFFLFGLFLAAEKNGPSNLFRVLLISGFIAALFGVFEAFSQKNPLLRFVSLSGDSGASRALIALATDKFRDGAVRAQSTFDHPIVFSQFIAALVPIAVYSAIYDKKYIFRFLGMLAIPISLLAIAKSGSRSGIVSVGGAIGLVCLVWWLRAIVHGKVSKAIAIMALPGFVFGIIISVYALNELVVGRSQHEMSSTSVRLLMLRDGISALWDSPLVGYGHGMSIQKAGVVNIDGVATIDNYFLSIALDYGYVGLGIFLLLVFVFSFWSLVFAVKNNNRDGAFVGAGLASVLALFITFAGLSIYQNMTMFWLVMCSVFPAISVRQRNGDLNKNFGYF